MGEYIHIKLVKNEFMKAVRTKRMGNTLAKDFYF